MSDAPDQKKPAEKPKKKERGAWSVRLEAARIAVEPNQTKFAKSIGISQPRYSQYESGRRDIPPEILERIVRTYPTFDLNFVFGAVPSRPLASHLTDMPPSKWSA
jgi:transcriptional regulator with XRE-family HTH domain